jgi:hypothetical protein
MIQCSQVTKFFFQLFEVVMPNSDWYFLNSSSLSSSLMLCLEDSAKTSLANSTSKLIIVSNAFVLWLRPDEVLLSKCHYLFRSFECFNECLFIFCRVVISFHFLGVF